MRLRTESSVDQGGKWWCVFRQTQVHPFASGTVAFPEGRATFRLVQVADGCSVLEVVV